MNPDDETRHAVNWRSVAAEMVDGTRGAIARFPVTSILLLLCALNASLLVEGAGLFGDDKNNFVMELVGGAIASLAATLFWEARSRNLWIRHCASFIAAVFAFALLWLDKATYTSEWGLLVALVGLIPVSAYIARGSATAFWLFAARLFFAIVLAVLALLLFAGGISAILASLTYLFGVGVPEELYAHIWILAGIFAAPLFGLGQIPHDLDIEPDLEGQTYAQRGIRALGEFVAVPLLLVYAVILHAYALKIVITREVPQGQIGWLVIAFGISVVGSLVVCRPFMRNERAPTGFFLRIWPMIMIVPILLLAYALQLRIGAYGITTDRYLVALFGLVLVILVVLQWFPALRGDIRLLVAVPVVALLLGSFGPQGASAVSLRNQAARFLEIVSDPASRESRADKALGALQYLSARDALARVAPEGFDGWGAKEGDYRAVAQAWGLDPDRERARPRRYFSQHYPTREAVAVSGFDLVVPGAELREGRSGAVAVTLPLPANVQLDLSLDADEIKIAYGDGLTVSFAVDQARIAAIMENVADTTPQIVLESQGRQIMLVPTYIYVTREPEAKISNFTGAIFLRSADWE